MNNAYYSISAVIPTYNSGRFIKDTISSLLIQTIELTEIIIVDDYSNDSTRSLLNELQQLYPQKLKLHFLPENIGSSEARNIGLRLALEPWVLLMDHDDLAEPDLVASEWQRLLELKTQSEHWVLVHSAYQAITETGEKLSGIHSWQQVEPEEILGYELIRNRILSNSGVLLNKEVALKVGGFDPSLTYSQDWDLWLRMAQHGGFGYVDKPLVKIRRHGNNTSRIVKNFIEDELQILQKYDLDFIEKAISKRHLPWELNRTDFVAVLYRMDHWEQGVSLLDDVIVSNPRFSPAYFLKGLYYLHQKNLNSARAAFQQTLRIEPNHGAAINNIAGISIIQGEFEGAKNLLTEALKLYPNFMDASHNLNLLNNEVKPDFDDIRFTWRELRPVLVSYVG